MFRTAELGQKISKSEFSKREPVLRQELLDVQRHLREANRFPVIILFAGVDGGGKGDTVNLLNEWMDTRWLMTKAYDKPSDEERERPEYWRFWRDLPSRGRIGLFLSSWYSQPILRRVYGKDDEATFDDRLDRILAFEKALADDGALILKFWMHLSHDAQEKRLKKLEKDLVPILLCFALLIQMLQIIGSLHGFQLYKIVAISQWISIMLLLLLFLAHVKYKTGQIRTSLFSGEILTHGIIKKTRH